MTTLRATGSLAFATVVAAALSGTDAAAQAGDQTMFYDENGLTLRWHLQTGIYAAYEGSIFWNLAEATAPGSGFEADKTWFEAFITPGLSLEYDLETGATLYGKVSAVGSYTFRTDPFDQGDTGDVTLEDAFIGLRGRVNDRLSYDISAGRQPLRLGTGMLISNGATSGFERGALKFGPRKAWEMSAIAKLTWNDTTGTFFYLDPNELPSTDGENQLAGLDLRWDSDQGGYLGATFVSVLNSDSPYPQATAGGPPVILDGAREGTNTLNLYGGTNPIETGLGTWRITTDVAFQRNDDVDLEAWAGRVQAIYSMPSAPWSPTVTVGYQTFSGDDPNTATLERFDPLYYQGSPTAWATGTKSASTFINSNVNALSVAVQVRPTQRDTITARYARISANELRSPIQFGQATRLDTSGSSANVVTGVTDAHLADDLFFEYSRVINRNTFLTLGAAVSFPGQGIDNVVGGNGDPWTGAFANIVISF